jgi:hypothetical protein
MAQNMLDKLRVCVVCRYYSLNGHLGIEDYMNHPSVCKLKCEHLDAVIDDKNSQDAQEIVAVASSASESKLARASSDSNLIYSTAEDVKPSTSKSLFGSPLSELRSSAQQPQQIKQFNVRICVGNVSKSLCNEPGSSASAALKSANTDDIQNKSQYNPELITHKWMVYVRSADCPKLDAYIKKVVFYLHSSYKPQDTIEVK